MKLIEFKTTAAQRIYEDYIKRSKKAIKVLSSEDQQEVLMEINSHIYEGTRRLEEKDEIDGLLDVLEKFGDPGLVLKPLVAEKKLEQAYRTFHPVHIVKALVLNIGNGISFLIFSFLYILLFGFIFCIGAKLVNPENVGLFSKDGVLQNLGSVSDAVGNGYVEVLGNWFIPLMLILSVLMYLLITVLLKWTRQLKLMF